MRTHRAVLVSSVFFGLLLGATPVVAEEVDDFLGMETLSSVQIDTISKSGTEILAHISAAREQIRKHDYQRARWETARARAGLEQVRGTSPALRLRDEIGRALGLARDSKAKENDLLPIFTELDAVTDSEAVADVRENVTRAKGHLAKGEQVEAVDALYEASSNISYLEIDLPIQETLNRVDRALQQLRHKDPLAAYATLGEAMDHTRTFVAVASSTQVDEIDVGAGPPR